MYKVLFDLIFVNFFVSDFGEVKFSVFMNVFLGRYFVICGGLFIMGIMFRLCIYK